MPFDSYCPFGGAWEFLAASFRREFLLEGCIPFGIGSEGRRASVSWTVRICFARASERVKARSHSIANKLADTQILALRDLPGNAQ